MTPPEANAWHGFVAIVQKFHGSKRASNYADIVQSMLDAYRSLGANMSIKVHYLHNQLDWFLVNCGEVTETKCFEVSMSS